MSTKADPKYSAGARYERGANLDAVNRRLAKATKAGDMKALAALQSVRKFITTRQTRYDQKAGGLGK